MPRAKRHYYLTRTQSHSMKQGHYTHFANGTGSEELSEQTQLLDDSDLKTEGLRNECGP